MRIKTLLVTVLLGAAVITPAVAGDAVYSINVVGYVTKSVPPGFSILVNPLRNTATNTVEGIIPSVPPGVTPPVPDGTVVYVWAVAGGYDNTTYYWNDPTTPDPMAGASWYPEGLTIDPGRGFFIFNPSASAISITFVGDVLEGNLTNTLPTGFSLQGSKVPQETNVTVMGIMPNDGDVIYQYVNGAGYNPSTFYRDDVSNPPLLGTWYPSPEDPYTGVGPVPQVGEGFFYFNSGNAWRPSKMERTFTVPRP